MLGKVRPILFSAPMVRAILAGQKTVTLRVISTKLTDRFDEPRGDGDMQDGYSFLECNGDYQSAVCFCPYGQPGDRLWVRESFWHAGDWVQTYPEDDSGDWCGTKRVHYRAEGAPPNEPNHHYPNGLRDGAYSAADPAKVWRARPSIHMPRWASRILLEITEVRVERLQAISNEQAEAEGIRQMRDGGGTWVGREGPGKLVTLWPTAKEAFADLWNSINGAGTWDANPWVWAVEFKRVMP